MPTFLKELGLHDLFKFTLVHKAGYITRSRNSMMNTKRSIEHLVSGAVGK